MALFLQNEARDPGRDVLLFGTGTIGRPIVRQLRRRTTFSTAVVDIPWTDAEGRAAALRTLEDVVRSLRRGPQLSVIWAAGRAGFSATEAQTAQELDAYREVLKFVQRVQHEDEPASRLHFHLVSSAGGLFEGKGVRRQGTEPSPLRSYGHLKLQQEEVARRVLGPENVTVYRPSSVYAVPAATRPGLVGVLVGNGIAHRVTTIVGAMSTLRDYVMADDVGAHIADNALRPRGEHVHMLVSGYPASIKEVIVGVEGTLRRPVYIRMAESWNARDITFSPSIAAITFSRRSLVEGIRSVHRASVGRTIT